MLRILHRIQHFYLRSSFCGKDANKESDRHSNNYGNKNVRNGDVEKISRSSAVSLGINIKNPVNKTACRDAYRNSQDSAGKTDDESFRQEKPQDVSFLRP